MDGEKITKDELYEIMVQTDGQEALWALIDGKLIDLEVKDERLKCPTKKLMLNLQHSLNSTAGRRSFQNRFGTKWNDRKRI